LAFLLLITAGVAFYALTFDRSAYGYILRADEGLNFSAAVRVSSGMVPQKDFSYSYGPIMPFFYAVGFRIFGISLANMRGLWALLYVSSIGMFYLIARQLVPYAAATCCSALLIGQLHTPLYSYNHVGLVLVLEAAVLSAFSLLATARSSLHIVWLSNLFVLGLLIKFNEAFITFGALVTGVLVIQLLGAGNNGNRWEGFRVMARDFGLGFGVAFALFVAITAVLNAGLTREEFHRNFPILPEYWFSVGGYSFVAQVLKSALSTPWTRANVEKWYTLWYDLYLPQLVISLLVAVATVYFAARVFTTASYRKRLPQEGWRALLVLCVGVAFYHEFYLTGNFWSTPMYVGFSIVGLTFLLWHGLRRFPRVRGAVLGALLIVMAVSDTVYIELVHHKYSEFHFDSARARIYTSNDSDASVVQDVVDFLQTQTPLQAEIAAFPHDALLISLANRQNALRDDSCQYGFFPNPDSDSELVQRLKMRNVQRVLVSNFVGVRRGEIVIFGRDYLPQTFQYIEANYHELREFKRSGVAYEVAYLERNTETQ
jgi:hypothetical protein